MFSFFFHLLSVIGIFAEGVLDAAVGALVSTEYIPSSFHFAPDLLGVGVGF